MPNFFGFLMMCSVARNLGTYRAVSLGSCR